MDKYINEFVDRKLEACERAYNSGNLGALQDAILWCEEYRHPLPPWVNIAIRGVTGRLLWGEKSGRRGRQARWIQQYREDMIDYTRAETVRECVDHSIPWMDAYYAASLILNGEFGEGTEDAIEKSYKRVQHRLKTHPGRYYILRSIPLPEASRGIRQEVWEEIRRLQRSQQGE